MAGVDDLIAFLKARLDEDEHWAHMAEAGWPPENALAASEDPKHYPFMATDITPSKATFIRRHDPARVLREVEAKRRLLELAWDADQTDRLLDEEIAREAKPGEVTTGGLILRAMAAIYSDHPDYRPEWKP